MRHYSRRFRLFAAASTAALALGGLTTALGSGSAQAADSAFAPTLVTVDTPTRADKARLQTLGLDLTEHAGHDYVEVVLHNGADLATLVGRGWTTTSASPTSPCERRRTTASTRRTPPPRWCRPLPSGRDTYRTLADYNDDIGELAAIRPTIAKRITMPHKSLDGRTVYGIEIGRDVNAAEDGRPTFVLLGVHHAREWPSGELPWSSPTTW